MNCRVVLLKLKDSNSGFKAAEILSKDFSISKSKAYEFVKRTPFTLHESVDQKKAEDIKQKYESCGCELEIIPESEAAKIKSGKRKYHSRPLTVKEILAELEKKQQQNNTKNDDGTISFYIKVGLIVAAVLFLLSLILSIVLIFNSKVKKETSDVSHQKSETEAVTNNFLKPSVSSVKPEQANTFYQQLINQGKFEEAVVYLNDRIHTSAANTDYYKFLGVAQYNIAYQKAEKEKWINYATNIDDFWECEHADRALFNFKKAVELNRNDYESLNYLGVIYSEKGWYERSERAYRESIRIKPSYMEAQNNLAILLRDTGRYMEAIETYRMIQANSPDSKIALLGLGVIYLEDIRDTAMARSYLEKYVAVEPRDINYIIVTQILNRING